MTSQVIFGKNPPRAHAEIKANMAMVVSGLEAVTQLLRHEFPRLRHECVIKDGRRVKSGTVLIRLTGPVTDILKVERVVLNLLQHLSGTSTLTARFVQLTSGLHVKILDTRKTTPGLRDLEKKAVRDGGGTNHRMNLSDAYMIKDNHIASAGSASAALQRVLNHRAHLKKRYPRALPIPVIIEVDTVAQCREILPLGPDIIVLDNMNPAQIRECVRLRGRQRKPLLEISGGVTLKNIHALARLGADRISIGALTHSAPAVDISLEIIRPSPHI